MSAPSPSQTSSGNIFNSSTSNSSLYLYTFASVLSILLAVSLLIAVRSYVRRRRTLWRYEAALRRGERFVDLEDFLDRAGDPYGYGMTPRQQPRPRKKKAKDVGPPPIMYEVLMLDKSQDFESSALMKRESELDLSPITISLPSKLPSKPDQADAFSPPPVDAEVEPPSVASILLSVFRPHHSFTFPSESPVSSSLLPAAKVDTRPLETQLAETQGQADLSVLIRMPAEAAHLEREDGEQEVPEFAIGCVKVRVVER